MIKRKKVIIDTDVGVDDTYALFYLATHPQIEVVGITTMLGNVPTPQAAFNARYLCHRFGQDHIPVAEGSHQPYQRPAFICADFVHGKDGLGNTFQAKNIGQNDPRPAHVMMCDIIRENPGEITIIAIAPMANIALALDHDPGIVELVKEVVIMGGAVQVNGNINPAAEANIYNDPEAAQKVFSATWPVTLFPLDVTLRGVIPRSQVNRFAQHNHIGEYLHQISQFYQQFCRWRDYKGAPVDGILPHDLHTAVYLTHPELFTFRQGGIHVVGGEGLLRGHMIMDDRARWSHPHEWTDLPKVKVCFDADHTAMFAHFEDRLKVFATHDHLALV
jgi:inosine-uridine nucleoside N-ribohydrolase